MYEGQLSRQGIRSQDRILVYYLQWWLIHTSSKTYCRVTEPEWRTLVQTWGGGPSGAAVNWDSDSSPVDSDLDWEPEDSDSSLSRLDYITGVLRAPPLRHYATVYVPQYVEMSSSI